MGGLLGDIGRSGAGQSLFNDLMKYRQQENQDALGFLQVQNQQQTLDIHKAQENRAQAEFDTKQKEYNTVVPLSIFFGPQDKWSASQKSLVDEASKAGYLEKDKPVPSIRMGRGKEFLTYLEKVPEVVLKSGAMKLTELDATIGELQQKLASNPEDEKTKALLSKAKSDYDTMDKAHTALATRLSAEKIAVEKAKVEGAGTHQVVQGSIVQSPTGPIFQKGLGEGTKQYNVMADKQGNVVSILGEKVEPKDNDIELRRKALAGDKEAQEILDSQMKDKLKLASEGRAVFSNMPTNTPGVSFERKTGRYFKTDAAGKKEYISSETTREERLKFIEDQPVSNLKTMQQSAPHVLSLVDSTRNSLEKAKDDMGPIKGRFSEFMAGKIGTTNKEWIAIRTNTKLLETRLMNMHVGARGGEYILKHFENIFAYGYQSPQNMIQALDDVETYARQVKRSKFAGEETPPPVGGGAPKTAEDLFRMIGR